MIDKIQKATKAKCKLDESTNSQFHGMYSSLQEAICWVLLELACRRTQNFTKNDQEKPKIEQINLHLEPHDYQINDVKFNIDLSHQNGIAVAKAQTPVLTKHP